MKKKVYAKSTIREDGTVIWCAGKIYQVVEFQPQGCNVYAIESEAGNMRVTGGYLEKHFGR